MELLIKSLRDALEYTPKNKTYAIRISSERSLDHLYDLVESDKWVNIASYVFDDIWPDMPGGLWGQYTILTDEKAKRIISDFKVYIPQTETLLVQCQRGRNRSPAVGIALNDIFELGYDTDSLKEEFPEFRPFVYDTFLQVGKDI